MKNPISSMDVKNVWSAWDGMINVFRLVPSGGAAVEPHVDLPCVLTLNALPDSTLLFYNRTRDRHQDEVYSF